ncbi:MAG: hypothetical protein DRG24_04295 [Epsilonproteobacteria bacterium]|nr:MAG: hypothetical protein DRG24_04295 [Campylobacterota bacterium]
MNVSQNELNEMIGKTLSVYRLIVRQDIPEGEKNILLKDKLFKDLDQLIDLMFEIQKRDIHDIENAGNNIIFNDNTITQAKG